MRRSGQNLLKPAHFADVPPLQLSVSHVRQSGVRGRQVSAADKGSLGPTSTAIKGKSAER